MAPPNLVSILTLDDSPGPVARPGLNEGLDERSADEPAPDDPSRCPARPSLSRLQLELPPIGCYTGAA